MTLHALKHLLHAASSLAEDRHFLVLGYASLLVSFPEPGEGDSVLATTYDADLCPEPFDELIAGSTKRVHDMLDAEERPVKPAPKNACLEKLRGLNESGGTPT